MYAFYHLGHKLCQRISDTLSRDHLLTCVKSLIDCNR